MDPMPPEVLLDAVPPAIAAIGRELRVLVAEAVPDAIERVRPGWGLIGYDAPAPGRRPAYFAYVAPESAHIHLGFEHGVAMEDPGGMLEGAGITRQVRWLTFRPGDGPDHRLVIPLVREARRLALLDRAARFEAVMRNDAARVAP